MAQPPHSRAPMARCGICGGDTFGPGPGGRLSVTGVPPFCVRCGSLERHRASRHFYAHVPYGLLAASHALQFAEDPAVDPRTFASFEISVYGGANSLDVTAIDRPDGAYGWVICNHVLEHVRDDAAAVRELLRVCAPAGVVHVTVPNPADVWATDDWGYPDPARIDHYRTYGADLTSLLRANAPEAVILAVGLSDAVTGAQDVVFLLTRAADTAGHLFAAARRARLLAVRLP